jgi:hypothetical protein
MNAALGIACRHLQQVKLAFDGTLNRKEMISGMAHAGTS